MRTKQTKRGKKKVNVVFDPEARREFLTGFHKRKVQRQKKAQDELKQKLKDEKKRIKQDAKEAYKKMVVSHRSVPEVEHLLEEEHDMGTHSVSIVELSTTDLAKQNNWIGTNQVQSEGQEGSEKVQYEGSEEKEEVNEDLETESIPGMEIKPKQNIVVKNQPKSAKDIKKAIKKQATKQVQKSKVFQLKNKIEKLKSKKKSLQRKRLKDNVNAKNKKGRR